MCLETTVKEKARNKISNAYEWAWGNQLNTIQYGKTKAAQGTLKFSGHIIFGYASKTARGLRKVNTYSHNKFHRNLMTFAH